MGISVLIEIQTLSILSMSGTDMLKRSEKQVLSMEMAASLDSSVIHTQQDPALLVIPPTLSGGQSDQYTVAD